MHLFFYRFDNKFNKNWCCKSLDSAEIGWSGACVSLGASWSWLICRIVFELLRSDGRRAKVWLFLCFMVKIYFSKWPTLPSENSKCSFRNILDSTKSVGALISSFMKTSMFWILTRSHNVRPNFLKLSPVAEFMWNGSWFLLFFVEAVVSNCKCSKFVRALYELKYCLFSDMKIALFSVAVAS